MINNRITNILLIIYLFCFWLFGIWSGLLSSDRGFVLIQRVKRIFLHLTKKTLLLLPLLWHASMKWTGLLLLGHFLLAAYPTDPNPCPSFFRGSWRLIGPAMGNCFQKPAKCAHASSTNFSGEPFFFRYPFLLSLYLPQFWSVFLGDRGKL